MRFQTIFTDQVCDVPIVSSEVSLRRLRHAVGHVILVFWMISTSVDPSRATLASAPKTPQGGLLDQMHIIRIITLYFV